MLLLQLVLYKGNQHVLEKLQRLVDQLVVMMAVGSLSPYSFVITPNKIRSYAS
jgi:hypothetical protein